MATTTIDAFAESLGRPIDLVKIDIQGGEVDALLGAEQTLRNRRVHNWIVETHGPQIHRPCAQIFERFSHRMLLDAPKVEHQPDGMVVAATGKR